jgi:hypothetical protein
MAEDINCLLFGLTKQQLNLVVRKLGNQTERVSQEN